MNAKQSGYRDMSKFIASHGTTADGCSQYVNLEDRTVQSNTVEAYSASSSGP